MDPLTLLLLVGGALASAGLQGYTSSNQLKAQREANETNIQLQKMANEAQIQQVQASNEFNAREAEKQRSWEEEMSNTSIQRAMADYSRAGLNPLLAVPGGASTPSGASASGNVAQIHSSRVDPAYLDLSGVASAFQSMTNLLLTTEFLKNSERRTNIQGIKTQGQLDRWKQQSFTDVDRSKLYRSLATAYSVKGYRRYR